MSKITLKHRIDALTTANPAIILEELDAKLEAEAEEKRKLSARCSAAGQGTVFPADKAAKAWAMFGAPFFPDMGDI